MALLASKQAGLLPSKQSGLIPSKQVASAQVLWTPLNLATPPSMYFSTADAASMTQGPASGGYPTVTAWASRAPNNPFSLLAGSGAPLLVPWNGKSALSGGVNYRYMKATGTGLFGSSGAATLMFVGLSIGSYVGSFSVDYLGGLGTVNNGQIGAPCQGNDLATGINYGANGNIVLVTWDGASTTNEVLYADGTVAASRTRSMPKPGTSAVIQVLINAAGSNGDYIQAAIGVPGIVSASDRKKLEGWAAWTFNLVSQLPSSHPYKSRAPYVSDP